MPKEDEAAEATEAEAVPDFATAAAAAALADGWRRTRKSSRRRTLRWRMRTPRTEEEGEGR